MRSKDIICVDGVLGSPADPIQQNIIANTFVTNIQNKFRAKTRGLARALAPANYALAA